MPPSESGDSRVVDVVVIGAGPAGEVAAARLAATGLDVVAVEAHLVGGECSYYACIPSKALLRPGAAVEAALAVDGARQAVTGTVDTAAALARRTRFTSGWSDEGQAAWLAENRVGLVRGWGRLAGPRVVEVGDARLHARHAVVVATGTTALLPPVPGLADAAPWTNREATRADAAPRRLVVMGGGPVACELATAWRSLGAEEVTVVEQGDRLLARVEPFAAEAVRAGLEARGIAVRTGARVVRVDRPAAGGPVRVAVTSAAGGEGGDGENEAHELLVAAGRRPATGDLGVEVVGLEPGKPLATDDSGRVAGVDGGWLWAVGDVTGSVLLTHMGKYEGRACAAAIVAGIRGNDAAAGTAAPPWSPTAATARTRAVTQVIYTRPEVAVVGLTEAEARAAGVAVRTVRVAIDVAGATLHADDYTGTAQLVVDDDRRVVVGATFVGPEVGEMLHSATIAVVGEVPLDRLWHAVPAFPSVSEVWLRLLEAYGL
jgi:pyruvate/2-oxoglutarate dehydrogenase complex dihydrolipoamide dehydrogenase (E3) component